MSSFTHTIIPGGIPDGFFDAENVDFVRNKAAELLRREYTQDINFDKASVIRIMQRILGERVEPVPKMNQRVLMTLTNEFRISQMDLRKKMKWEEHYIESQRLYDPTTERVPDLKAIKLAQKRGRPTVGGTVRFTFIA